MKPVYRLRTFKGEELCSAEGLELPESEEFVATLGFDAELNVTILTVQKEPKLE